MKIKFVRSGGFAGIRLAGDFDTSVLPADRADTLERLVEASGFFDLPELAAPSKVLPDTIEYRITVSSSERTRAILVTETTMPAALRPLADYLLRLVKLGHPPKGS